MRFTSFTSILATLIYSSLGRCGELERIRVTVNESMAELYPRHIKAAIYYSIGMQEYKAERYAKTAEIFRIIPPPKDAQWLTRRDGVYAPKDIIEDTASIKEIHEYREAMRQWQSDENCTPLYRGSMLNLARSLRLANQLEEATTHHQSQNSQDMRWMFPDYRREYWLFLEAKAGHEKDPTVAKVTWNELLKARRGLTDALAQSIESEKRKGVVGPKLTRIENLYCESVHDLMRCTIHANEQIHRENPEDLTKHRLANVKKLIEIETKNSPEIPNEVRKLYRKVLEDHKELGKAYLAAEGKGFPDK